MNDLTIIFYTANHISDYFMANIQKQLLKAIGDTPIISVSHKPMKFGQNICVGEIGRSTYNLYKQVLIGAKYAKAGDWQRAAEIWERSASSLPGDPGLWHNIGVAYEALGSYDKALESYKRASDLDPANETYIQDQAGVRNAYRRGLVQ